MSVDSKQIEERIKELINQGKKRKEIVDELEGVISKTSVYNYIKKMEYGGKIKKEKGELCETFERYEENIRTQAKKRLKERKIRESISIGDTVTIERLEHENTKHLVKVTKKGILIQKTETQCIIKMKNYVECFAWEDVVFNL